MDLVNCPDCGLELTINEDRCIGCGRPVNTPVSPPEQAEEDLPPLEFPEDEQEKSSSQES